MGRPPSNGGPAFRFNSNEVAELEAILKDHRNAVPEKEIMVALAEKFSDAPDRKGKFVVQMKQIWNWFQNKRYALRAKSGSARNVLQPAASSLHIQPAVSSLHIQPAASSLHIPMTAPVPAPVSTPPVQPSGTGSAAAPDNTCMEFEARSARDGAWYDVQSFLAHRNLESNDPEVQVRFTGFGADEDEWVIVRRHVRPRSLPCEASECVAVLPGDLILCFQEGKDQALYFNAHVLDAQRRRHDARGCRCRFLVRYDHDQSEEIVPLRKVCRRPETDFRLQQLHAAKDSASTDQQKTSIEPEASTITTLKPNSSGSSTLQINTTPMMPRPSSSGVTTVGPLPLPHANIPVATNSSIKTGSSNISTNTSASPSSAASTNAPMNNIGPASSGANVQG